MGRQKGVKYKNDGRPKGSTKYVKEMDDKAEEFLAQGYSLEALRGHLLINRSTLTEWMDEDGPYFKPSLSASIKKGLDRGRLFWEEIGFRMATQKHPGNFVVWIFNMKNRYGWTDRTEVKQETTITNFQDFVRSAYEEARKQSGDAAPSAKPTA